MTVKAAVSRGNRAELSSPILCILPKFIRALLFGNYMTCGGHIARADRNFSEKTKKIPPFGIITRKIGKNIYIIIAQVIDKS